VEFVLDFQSFSKRLFLQILDLLSSGLKSDRLFDGCNDILPDIKLFLEID